MVKKELVGSVMGFTASLEAMCGIFVPPLVGVLFDKYGDASGALVSAGATGVGVMLLVGLWKEEDGGEGEGGDCGEDKKLK